MFSEFYVLWHYLSSYRMLGTGETSVTAHSGKRKVKQGAVGLSPMAFIMSRHFPSKHVKQNTEQIAQWESITYFCHLPKYLQSFHLYVLNLPLGTLGRLTG